MGVRHLVLTPAVVHASIIAYDKAVEILVGPDPTRKQLTEIVRSDLAFAIVNLAEQGVTDPQQMKDAALARVRIRGT